MASILAEPVEVYVRKLIAEELAGGMNRNFHQRYRTHVDGKTTPEPFSSILDARFEPDGEETRS